MGQARKKILCIEDDREAAALIVEELFDQGFEPIAAYNGREGFDVFLTAMSDRENELRGRRLGADDFVVKPIDFDVLHAIITDRLAGVASHRTPS
jgi:DNA-binding response OmpR family regulator